MSFTIYQESVLKNECENSRQMDNGNGIETAEYFFDGIRDKHSTAAKKFWRYLNLNREGSDIKKIRPL